MEDRAEIEARIDRLAQWEKYQARLHTIGEQAKQHGLARVEPELMRNLAEYVQEVKDFVVCTKPWLESHRDSKKRVAWQWVRNWLQLCDWIMEPREYTPDIGETQMAWGAIMPLVKLRKGVQHLTTMILHEWYGDQGTQVRKSS